MTDKVKSFADYLESSQGVAAYVRAVRDQHDRHPDYRLIRDLAGCYDLHSQERGGPPAMEDKDALWEAVRAAAVTVWLLRHQGHSLRAGHAGH